MSAERSRLAELDREIKAADARWWKSFSDARDKRERGEWIDEEESSAQLRAQEEIARQRDILKAKRANVVARLPEDFGLPNIEARS